MKKLLLSVVSCFMAVCAMAADNVTLTIAAEDIVNGKTGDVALGSNTYGKQAVATDSTWYNFTYTKYDFTGCRICTASAANGGGIQFQGNDKDATKQGFIGNKTAFKNISKIEVTARVGISSIYSPAFNVYSGSEVLPKADTLKADTVKTADEKFKTYKLTYTLATPASYFAIRNDLAGALYIDEIKVTYEGDGTIIVPAPKFETKAGSFISSDTIIIKTEDGTKVFYTTDGTDPKTSATAKEYTEAIALTATATIKAAAKNGETWSEEVSATYTCLTPLVSLAEVYAAATDDEADAAIKFDGLVCTGVSGNYFYFTDGKGNGISLYMSNAGFVAGDSLSGTAIVTLLKYKGAYAQLKNLTKNTEGITITKDAKVTPVEIASDELTYANQGAVVTLKGLSYNAEKKILTDGLADITPYNSFKITDYPTFNESAKITYDVTGVIVYFVTTKDEKPVATLEIAPRSKDDVVTITTLFNPESAWSAASEEVFEGKTAKATFSTKSTSAVTYKSSDEKVATVSAEGVITAVAKGKATITAETAENEDYSSSSTTITINVVKENEALFTKAEFEGQGTASTGSEVKAEKNGVKVVANKAYWKEGNAYLQVYGTSEEAKSSITITAPEGKHIAKVVMTASGASYLKTWNANDKVVTIEEKSSSMTWEGIEDTLVLDLTASSQARISSIEVTLGDGTKEAASVESIAADKRNGAVYSISGQKVNENYKGIVVEKGKKYLRK